MQVSKKIFVGLIIVLFPSLSFCEELLEKQLRSGTEVEQIEAVQGLHLMGDNRDFSPLLIRLLSSQKKEVRLKAAIALAHVQPRQTWSAPILSGAIRYEADPKLRIAAIEALGHLNNIPEQSMDDLILALRDRDPNIQLEVVKTLGHFPSAAEKIAPHIADVTFTSVSHFGYNMSCFLDNLVSPFSSHRFRKHEEDPYRTLEGVKALGEMGKHAIPYIRWLVDIINKPRKYSGEWMDGWEHRETALQALDYILTSVETSNDDEAKQAITEILESDKNFIPSLVDDIEDKERKVFPDERHQVVFAHLLKFARARWTVPHLLRAMKSSQILSGLSMHPFKEYLADALIAIGGDEVAVGVDEILKTHCSSDLYCAAAIRVVGGLGQAAQRSFPWLIQRLISTAQPSNAIGSIAKAIQVSTIGTKMTQLRTLFKSSEGDQKIRLAAMLILCGELDSKIAAEAREIVRNRASLNYTDPTDVLVNSATKKLNERRQYQHLQIPTFTK